LPANLLEEEGEKREEERKRKKPSLLHEHIRACDSVHAAKLCVYVAKKGNQSLLVRSTLSFSVIKDVAPGTTRTAIFNAPFTVMRTRVSKGEA